MRGREAILKIHAKDKQFANDVNLKSIAEDTAGFTGADLANILNESAIIATINEHEAITNKDIEDAVRQIQTALKSEAELEMHFSARYLAIKLMEDDKEVISLLRNLPNFERIKSLRDGLVSKIEELHQEDIAATIANSKYGFVSGALRETLHAQDKEEAKTTAMIDSVVTSKLFGFPIFIFFMWLMFWATFEIGQYPMDWIGRMNALRGSAVEIVNAEVIFA